MPNIDKFKKIKWSSIFALLSLSLIIQNAHAFTLNVVDGSGNPVTGFRWLVEEDTTHPVTPGVVDPNSLGVGIHRSSAPGITNGTEQTSSVEINIPADKRYVVSVLPTSGGYTMSGTNVAKGQHSATVTVNALPIKTAQISVFVFEDRRPINNAPDIPFERGLEGFTIAIFDQLGQMSLDALGNPLGTTYNADGSVATMGTGIILTDTNGEAQIKNLPPGKYGVQAIPPTGSGWVQNNTIEGTRTIDAWVKSNEPNRLIEFGPGLYHVFYGFVQPFDNMVSLPQASNPANPILDPLTGVPLVPQPPNRPVTGRIVSFHTARPPDTGVFLGNPVPQCWIGLNVIGGDGVYAAPCNPDGTFTINNVPPGLYQLVMWDVPLDYIFGFTTVTVPLTNDTTPVALGDVPMNAWFGNFKGSVFYDTNQNGFRDAGEIGISGQNINLRFRDGSIYKAFPTDANGNYVFNEVFPFFKYLIAEVDFARFKATGATIVVDNGGPLNTPPATDIYPGTGTSYGSMGINPQLQPENSNLPYRTELGPVLLEAMTLYADQTNRVDWGKVNYAPGENGGISGVIIYATTRAEDDPRLAAADPWEPGIARVQVNLYADFDADGVIDDQNGDGIVTPADTDNHPLGWKDGGPKGPEDIDRNGNGVFDPGDALNVATSDSFDDNLPTGCVGPQEIAFGFPVMNCAETMKTWNQLRPAVFDGGYAFDAFFPGGMASGNSEVSPLPAGTYIVEAVTPPGYELFKEEDKNVDFGDSYEPSPLLLPPPCVGEPHLVPDELSLFPGVPGAFAGQTRPLCDRKQIIVTGDAGRNSAGDFHFFTSAPKAGRGIGLITNDLAIEANQQSPVFTEKSPKSWLPISVQDHNGKELLRTYTDQWGIYNFLVPSTYTVNPPIPTGVSPNMLRLCLNHPGPIPDPNVPGKLMPDPFFDTRVSLTCYTFDFWPGKITYLDTPVIPTAAFAGAQHTNLDCEFPAGTPVITDVTASGGTGPYAAAADGTAQIIITSPGSLDVTNPDCGQFDPNCSTTITRDYGFGTAVGNVTVGGVPLTITSWSNTVITGTVPAGMQTGQLLVIRGDNGKTSVNSVTVTVGGPAPRVVTSGQSIQAAIDAAPAGSLIIVRPGEYKENLIIWKPLRLQGSGASTIINASAITPENLQVWKDGANALVNSGVVDLVPGQNPDLHLEAGAITVLAKNDGSFASNPARIDGFSITSATTGGGIQVNGYAPNLEISNNRLINNQGSFGGGIRLGTPSLTDLSCSAAGTGYCSSHNENIKIHNNHITQNGASAGTTGGGGIAIYNGSDSYSVTDNYICGNFTTVDGGGVEHFGLSNNGHIANNRIIMNESSFGTATGGDGGGILVRGEPAPIAAPLGTLTQGTGNVTIASNLIQGNLAGSGFGGGILATFINGQDVLASPDISTPWYSLKIFNNIIVDNVAGLAGGGIFLEDTAKADVSNNTVANNDSTATGANAFIGGALLPSTPQGAGIVSRSHSNLLAAAIGTGTGPEFAGFSNPSLYNNIVWQNRSFYWDPAANGGLGGLVRSASPFQDQDLLVIGFPEAPTAATLDPQYCLLTSTTGYADPLKHNISGDPGFISWYQNQLQTAIAPQEGGNIISVTYNPLTLRGDYHILSSSAALDKGITAFSPVDYDGEIRQAGPAVDIGADEIQVDTFTITASSGTNGTISPSGTVTVVYGSNKTFTMNPDPGYGVLDMVVDGVSKGSSRTYTFNNVREAGHSISVTFTKVPDIKASPAALNLKKIRLLRTAQKTVVIKNTGLADLVISNAEIIGTDGTAFQLKNWTGPRTIVPGATSKFTLLFRPLSKGPKTATLRLHSNDPDTPALDIPLSGSGI